MKNKRNALIALLICSCIVLTSCGGEGDASGEGGNTLYVYNWGEYIDPETIEMFEEETGYKVVYDLFETNEIMYPKVAAAPWQYDVICPSDYMISKMCENDLLAEIDIDDLPNARANIGSEYWEMSRHFDPENKYSVPYVWGTVGILYNTTMVDGEIDSWDVLWDPKYNDNILMQDSVRDLFMVALKKLGYSMNTSERSELEEAKELLIEQKPIVQAYVVDEVRDKMIAGEAAIGVIYCGEAEETRAENEDLEYVIPKEGSNIWLDSWVITKESRHKEAAMAWIDFMCRPDIAVMNFDYICYPTPNIPARDLMDEETKANPTLFPDLSRYENMEAFRYLGEETERTYYDLWKEIKSA